MQFCGTVGRPPPIAKFAQDMEDWSKICGRLYVWDYVTDFGHYIQPHPNWFELGPNLRFFAKHNVRGVFEEGAYQSNGAEMAEMPARLGAGAVALESEPG